MELAWEVLDSGRALVMSFAAAGCLELLPPFKKLREELGVFVFRADDCSSKEDEECRRLKVLTNVAAMRLLERQCTCSTDSDDEPAPPQECSLASRYLNALRESFVSMAIPLGKRLELERPPEAHTFQFSRHWRPQDRWYLLFKGVFQREEQIAILELCTLGLLARHLTSPRKIWHKRHLVFSHSMAAGGAASKGRSGVFGLLLVCRQLLVVQVTLGICLIVRWVPSAFNYSDYPSRGGPVGVHPDTLVEHADQLQDVEESL